jgi:hypothetical protein
MASQAPAAIIATDLRGVAAVKVTLPHTLYSDWLPKRWHHHDDRLLGWWDAGAFRLVLRQQLNVHPRASDRLPAPPEGTPASHAVFQHPGVFVTLPTRGMGLPADFPARATLAVFRVTTQEVHFTVDDYSPPPASPAARLGPPARGFLPPPPDAALGSATLGCSFRAAGPNGVKPRLQITLPLRVGAAYLRTRRVTIVGSAKEGFLIEPCATGEHKVINSGGVPTVNVVDARWLAEFGLGPDVGIRKTALSASAAAHEGTESFQTSPLPSELWSRTRPRRAPDEADPAPGPAPAAPARAQAEPAAAEPPGGAPARRGSTEYSEAQHAAIVAFARARDAMQAAYLLAHRTGLLVELVIASGEGGQPAEPRHVQLGVTTRVTF